MLKETTRLCLSRSVGHVEIVLGPEPSRRRTERYILALTSPECGSLDFVKVDIYCLSKCVGDHLQNAPSAKPPQMRKGFHKRPRERESLGNSKLTFKISIETADTLPAHLLEAMIRIPLQALCQAILGSVVAGCAATRKTRHMTDENRVWMVSQDSMNEVFDSTSSTTDDAALIQASA